MPETKTTSQRSAALAAIQENIGDYAIREHSRNYHKLYVRRDGSLFWEEHINKSDGLIDAEASRFQSLPSVAVVGTGSCLCNCDFCNNVYSADEEERAIEAGRKYDKADKFATIEDAIATAAGDSDFSEIYQAMERALDAIDIGYFADEQGEV